MGCWQQLPLLLCLWHRRIDLSFLLKCELVWRLYPDYSSQGQPPRSQRSCSTWPWVTGGFHALVSPGEASSTTRPHPPALLREADREWALATVTVPRPFAWKKPLGRQWHVAAHREQGGASSAFAGVYSWCGRAQELCTGSWQSVRSHAYHGVH